MAGMSESPIHDFIWGSKSFHVHDIAVLLFLVGLQERNGILSPAVATKRMFSFDGITEEEYRAAFKRLEDAGEVVWMEDDQGRGYFVDRYLKLSDDLAENGARQYFRKKAKANRERKKAQVVA